ncbi:MAG: hypothetical protein BGO98_04795 [Myxococcales bacterium 68-20]|nr:MAG: hypothetical protein BGO98_04795 [Myxococcales bacterium 68-20]
MIRTVLLASVLAVCVGCKGSKNDPVVSVSDTDPELNAAIAEAKRRWPEFVTAFNEGTGERFSAKYPFPKSTGSVEHVWLSVTTINADQVTGTLDNDPVGDIGHKRGETVTVPSKDISDWLYSVSGKNEMVGGFTIKVLLARERR